MWDTPHGKRILIDTEAALFAEGLLTLIDDSEVWNFEDYDMGIKAYDQLSPGQQVASLRAIAQGLLNPKSQLIRHTAALEGTIAAVFRQIEDRLEVELDDTEVETDWRELILAARKEAEAEDLPDLSCEDFDEWQFQISQIEGSILFDNDYDTSELTMDLPPEQAEAVRENMGIPDDYIQTLPDDLNEKQMTVAIADIRHLCSEIAAE